MERSDELSDPAAHCDDANYLTGSYPHMRGEATASLADCVNHLRSRYREAVDGVADLLGSGGGLDPEDVVVDFA
jgi:hypothetical protein